MSASPELLEDIRVGDVVQVAPRYVMAEHPPFIGNGTFASDNYTGEVFRVVALRGFSAALAPTDLLEVDESDEVVDIVFRRLTVVSRGDK